MTDCPLIQVPTFKRTGKLFDASRGEPENQDTRMAMQRYRSFTRVRDRIRSKIKGEGLTQANDLVNKSFFDNYEFPGLIADDLRRLFGDAVLLGYWTLCGENFPEAAPLAADDPVRLAPGPAGLAPGTTGFKLRQKLYLSTLMDEYAAVFREYFLFTDMVRRETANLDGCFGDEQFQERFQAGLMNAFILGAMATKAFNEDFLDCLGERMPHMGSRCQPEIPDMFAIMNAIDKTSGFQHRTSHLGRVELQLPDSIDQSMMAFTLDFISDMAKITRVPLMKRTCRRLAKLVSDYEEYMGEMNGVAVGIAFKDLEHQAPLWIMDIISPLVMTATAVSLAGGPVISQWLGDLETIRKEVAGKG